MEAVKAVVLCMFAFGLAVEEAKKNDGKFTFGDLLLLGKPLRLVPDAYANAKDAESQWKNSTPEAREEFMKWARQELNLSDKKTERHVEAAIAIAVNVADFFKG